MSCLSAERREELQSQYDSLTEQIAAIDTALSDISGVESYSFDSGAGKQQTKYRSLSSMRKERKQAVAEQNRIRNLLNGTGLVNVALRRKPGRCNGYY